ncbi:phytanoyl-CoA dioxygenase family protein [Okeania sp.]|uniref:phytanoyl-CoA dioxygenase family protein n=1 Tax=Okeania sp. TaxID=3100323 RepID=UPI002B4B0227|nr:phytanoyl-CoA dioxygenase family protein [Okeania sp.]MEB3341801.1 phytanoyl-CoA dioxygenase family protein [Okeania sp.]
MSLLVNKITISAEEKKSFAENGFLKLKKLFTDEAIDKLQNLIAQSNQVQKVPESYSGDFSRVGYDLENAVTKNIYSDENFKNTLKQLIANELIFTQGVGFELKPNKKGFPFHLDLVSFNFIKPEDLAYSIWIPLVPINTKEQHGGMAYVPQKAYPTFGYYALRYEAIQHQDFAEFCQTEDFNYLDFFYASKLENLVLEKNKVEDDFEVGDALLLDKFVWHRSVPLLEGKLPSRMAYTMRFVDSQARYSKIFLDGLYSLIKAKGDDTLTSFGYKLTDLKEGDFVSHSKFI